MIKTALKVKEPLTYIFKNTESKEYKRIFLTPAEWITLQQLEKVFSVLVQPTVRLQSEYYTNINKALLFVYSIFNKLEAFIMEFEAKAIEEPELVSLFHVIIINTVLSLLLIFMNLLIG